MDTQRLRSVCYIAGLSLFTYNVLATALPAKLSTSSEAMMTGYWDSFVVNHTPYTLTHPLHTKDEKGWLINSPLEYIHPQHEELAFQLEANYLGQISQEMSYTLEEHDSAVGECVLHAGVGSYLANPDFTGTQCTLYDGNEVAVTPSYSITNNNLYQVKYTLGSQQKFSRIFAFGDSLSDNGNLWSKTAHQIPVSPPYFHGRFSDGRVWVEYLADYLQMSNEQLQDYAYGGAASSKAQLLPVTSQIIEYKWLNFSGDPYALYIIWVGANELFGGAHDKEATSEKLLSHISSSIRDLANYGAKTFLIPNLPNLGITADAVKQDAINGNHDYSSALREETLYYNAQLEAALPALANELHVKIVYADVNGTFEDIVAHPTQYGLTNSTEACNPNGALGGDLPVCEEPCHYLFWDEIHPTTVVHHYLAERVYKSFGFDREDLPQASAVIASQASRNRHKDQIE